jgi:ribonuclease HI
MQTITVCTDAGFKKTHKQSVAIWATYIRTPEKTIHSSGIMSKDCKGSSHAELYAVANALHILNQNFDLTKYKVIFYSDSLYALKNHIDGSITKTKSKADRQKVYDKYIRPYLDKAAAYEARHVKAHLPKSQWGATPARFYMQDWCDQEVHRVMKIGIQIAIEKARKG